MKRHFPVCPTAVFLLAVLAVAAVLAEDKPKVVKKNGVPYEALWTEEDVANYLKLPRLLSTESVVAHPINEIAKRIEAVQEVAGYQLVKDNDRLLKASSSNELPAVTFELRREGMLNFQVSVYDQRSWNALCDKLFKFITSTVELWSKIPDYYSREEGNDTYTLTRKGRQNQKWHFARKQHYVIAVEAGTIQEVDRREEKALAEIDKVIGELVKLIEKTK